MNTKLLEIAKLGETLKDSEKVLKLIGRFSDGEQKVCFYMLVEVAYEVQVEEKVKYGQSRRLFFFKCMKLK